MVTEAVAPKGGRRSQHDRDVLFAYFLGVAVTLIAIAAIAGGYYYLQYRDLGERETALLNGHAPSSESESDNHTPTYRDILSIPDNVLAHLKDMRAVISNAYNPTEVPRHDTLLVRPDPDLGFILRENVSLRAFILPSVTSWNLDPPVIYLPERSVVTDDVRNFLRSQKQIELRMTTTQEGLRTTNPTATADSKILIVGDSVAFGLMVSDEDTIASLLQRKLGSRAQVINAAVGGYNGAQAFMVAQRRLGKDGKDHLVYVACQNDFMLDASKTYWEVAETVIEKMRSLQPYYKTFTIVLVSYMEYTERRIIGRWTKRMLEQTNQLRGQMREFAAAHRIEFIDWAELVDGYRVHNASVFAPFALYGDHAHLSSAGHSLIVDKLFDSLQID